MRETRALQSELVVRQGKEPVRLGKSVASVLEAGPEVHSSSEELEGGRKVARDGRQTRGASVLPSL